MYDVDKGLTEQKLEIVESNKLHRQVSGKLFHSDDTIIMAKTAEAVEIILHRVETESHKYALKLNQGKCIHIQMNAVHRIHFRRECGTNPNSSRLPRRKNQKHRGPQNRAPTPNSGHMENSSETGSTMGEIESQRQMENKSI